jgi:hypothetical protein
MRTVAISLKLPAAELILDSPRIEGLARLLLVFATV